MTSPPRDVAAGRPDAGSAAGAPAVSPGLAGATLVEAAWLLFLAWMAVRGG